MFDLFRSREKVVRWFLSALLLLVALSMVTYLIPSYGSGDRTQDTVVAQIGKDTITLRDAQAVLQAQLRNRNVSPELMSMYVPRIIDQMISERVLAYEANRLGLKVSDEDVSSAIRASLPALFQDGKFPGRDVYAAFLAQQNLTIPEFESETARQVLVNRLLVVAVEGTVVSPAEIEQEFRRRQDRIKIQYVKISADKLKSEAEPTPAEIKDVYDKNRSAYTVGEKRNLAILVLDQAKVEQSINVSDAELRRLYDSERDQFRTPERANVRHILLKTAGKPADEDAKMKAKGEDLLKQIKAGGDFAALAQKNSEDPGSAAKGGDLGWIVRGQTVKPFEDAAFSLKPKEVSGVIKTEYGYHIIQVLEHEQAKQKSFEEAKSQLAEEARKQRGSQMMAEIPDRMEAALKKDSPAKAASDLHLAPPLTVENVGLGDPVPEIGVNQDFQQSIAGLQKGAVSQPVAVPPNRVVIALVTGVTPSRPATLEEAQARIRPALERQKLEQVLNKRAQEFLAKAQAVNGDLEKAAKSFGLEVKTPGPFDRLGAVEGLGQAGYVAEAFNKPDGSVFGPISLPDGRIIGQVLEHLPADMSKFAGMRAGLRDELKSKKAKERAALFEASIREQLIKEGKVKIHQDVVNRLIASYHG
jgi:peptidyl-prolyl cis-trans isomerase D